MHCVLLTECKKNPENSVVAYVDLSEMGVTTHYLLDPGPVVAPIGQEYSWENTPFVSIPLQ